MFVIASPSLGGGCCFSHAGDARQHCGQAAIKLLQGEWHRGGRAAQARVWLQDRELISKMSGAGSGRGPEGFRCLSAEAVEQGFLLAHLSVPSAWLPCPAFGNRTLCCTLLSAEQW